MQIMQVTPPLTLNPVETLSSLSRLDFLEAYRHRRPVLVKGGGTHLPAFQKWTLDYLEQAIGGAAIVVSDYAERPNDFTRVGRRGQTFGEFARKFREPDHGEKLYWFNIMDSGNFWANPWHGAARNADLHCLAADFCPPRFVRESEVIYAQIILGSSANGTRLHYDWGGEAKTLIQIAGRKHVLLMDPASAAAARPNPVFDGGGIESACGLDLRGALASGAAVVAASPPPIAVLEATLEPGDALYWPSFWLHDVINLDDFTLAINAPLDELAVNVLFLRQATVNVLTELVNYLGDRGQLEPLLSHVRDFVGDHDRRLLASGPELASLWRWQPSLSGAARRALRGGQRQAQDR